jgi:hypothetical protein
MSGSIAMPRDATRRFMPVACAIAMDDARETFSMALARLLPLRAIYVR